MHIFTKNQSWPVTNLPKWFFHQWFILWYCLLQHRVATIMDYDKVIVLDNGHIIENDSPQALLEQPDSVFSSFVKTAKWDDHVYSQSKR